jgi:hypothetical protein
VAADTADAAVHVGAVVEVDEVGQVVDPHPGDGLAGGVALLDEHQLGALGEDRRVAVQTGLRRRDRGVGRVLHGRVTVPAIHAQLVDVQRVTVGHGLLRLVAHVRVLRGVRVRGQQDDVDGSPGDHDAEQLDESVEPGGKTGRRLPGGSGLVDSLMVLSTTTGEVEDETSPDDLPGRARRPPARADASIVETGLYTGPVAGSRKLGQTRPCRSGGPVPGVKKLPDRAAKPEPDRPFGWVSSGRDGSPCRRRRRPGSRCETWRSGGAAGA